VNEIFSVDVNLNLVSGEVINGFDVRVNYTNPHSGISQGVLRAASIDYSTNIFSPYGNTVLEQCIDGVAVNNGSGCTSDVLGQVHFGEFVLGRTLPGPLTGRLFSVTFQVTGGGNSTFTVDTATVVNPTPDLSNSGLISPQYIPVLKKAGVFGNFGVTAFFDYQPDYSQDSIVSPSILPNQPASFDASNSFVANDSLMGFRSYYWSFGDTGTLNGTASVVSHTFGLPGAYTVALTVTDNKGQTGSLSRRVSVLPALGNIALTVENQAGTLQRLNVRVRVFNSSSSSTPFLNQTTDGNGQVNINRLVPADYYLTFSGAGIVTSSKMESAIPGFTRQDTVHVSFVPVPQDYSGLIYLGTILGGLAIITGLIVYQKSRRSAKKSGKAHGQPLVTKPGRRRTKLALR
jgi:PKD repeat protein